jgi:hypothetical protein
MAPIHHHFELGGWPETTVIIRFWIIAGLCTALALGLFYADFMHRHLDDGAARRVDPVPGSVLLVGFGVTNQAVAPRWSPAATTVVVTDDRPGRRRPRRSAASSASPPRRGPRRGRARALVAAPAAVVPEPGPARPPPGVRLAAPGRRPRD